MKVLVTQTSLKLFNPKDCSPPGPSVHGILQGRILESGWLGGGGSQEKELNCKKKKKTTGAGCHSLLQEIFLIQGSNPGLLHCRQILYH